MPIEYLHRKYSRFVVLISLLLTAGCSSQQLIPDSGQNIKAIYEQHVGSTLAPAKMYRQLRDDRRDLAGYTRYASNEIESQFPMLPNPDLTLYVFPHLSRKGHPVPGYATAFKMYQKDEYALPGEIAR